MPSRFTRTDGRAYVLTLRRRLWTTFTDALGGDVDVLVGRRAAEAEADRRAGAGPAAPIASSTCDGAWLPELQAEPVETARSPSAISSALPFDARRS